MTLLSYAETNLHKNILSLVSSKQVFKHSFKNTFDSNFNDSRQVHHDNDLYLISIMRTQIGDPFTSTKKLHVFQKIFFVTFLMAELKILYLM